MTLDGSEPDERRDVKGRHARRRLLLLPAGAIVLMVTAGAVWHSKTAQVPFDATRWAQGDPKVRFLMKDSLVAMHAEGQFPTRDAVNQLLGPDDEPVHFLQIRTYELMEWYGNPWYLQIKFDEQGNVCSFNVSVS